MNAIVFSGPTLPASEIRARLDAECWPPVAQGDIYRAARRMPRCIGIIDGYFEGVPSVWHKEILWAMAQGIRVFGSASMGALRAAELADFGMTGVGRIFEDYRSGRLTDDDEVAVLHAPAELGFEPLSEPMVSIRATIERALAEGVLKAGPAESLIARTKAMNYRARSWEAVLAAPELAGRNADFATWLESGRIDAKRADAIAMLEAMGAALETDELPAPAAYSFERTQVWQGLVRRIEAEDLAVDDAASGVLEELRLDPRHYRRMRDRALLRGLALDAAGRHGVEADRPALIGAMSRHRSRNGLFRRRDLAEWLSENGLEEADYERLLAEAHLIDTITGDLSAAVDRHIVAELKWSGGFAELRRRAGDKARVLGADGSGEAAPSLSTGRDPLRWYFEERLGEAVPDDLDAYAGTLGLASRHELYRILGREYLYSLSDGDQREGDQTV